MKGTVIALVLSCVCAPAALAQLPDEPAGVETVAIPGWEGLLMRNPDTDGWRGAVVHAEGILMMCDGEYPTGLRTLFGPYLPIPSGPVEVEYSIGSGPMMSARWKTASSDDGASVALPASLTSQVLRAERLTLRVRQGQPRVIEWRSGYEISKLMLGVRQRRTLRGGRA